MKPVVFSSFDNKPANGRPYSAPRIPRSAPLPLSLALVLYYGTRAGVFTYPRVRNQLWEEV